MTRLRRIGNLISGLAMILMGIFLLLSPDGGLETVTFLIGIAFTLRGIGSLTYYFRMARYMVGGRSVLFRGLLFLELGTMTSSMADHAAPYLILYMAGLHLFYGLVDMLNAHDAKNLGASSWRSRMAYGAANVIIAILVIVAGFTLNSINIVVGIYGAGLIYAGCVRVGSAFRRTAIVYIQ